MKHLTSIQAVSQPFKGFWMATAYRIPKGKFPVVDRFVTQETEANTPITEMVVNSLVTNLRDGMRCRQVEAIDVRGVAWDGGYGMRDVEVSIDGGEELASGRSWARTWVASPGASGAIAIPPHRAGQLCGDG